MSSDVDDDNDDPPMVPIIEQPSKPVGADTEHEQLMVTLRDVAMKTKDFANTLLTNAANIDKVVNQMPENHECNQDDNHIKDKHAEPLSTISEAHRDDSNTGKQKPTDKKRRSHTSIDTSPTKSQKPNSKKQNPNPWSWYVEQQTKISHDVSDGKARDPQHLLYNATKSGIGGLTKILSPIYKKNKIDIWDEYTRSEQFSTIDKDKQNMFYDQLSSLMNDNNKHTGKQRKKPKTKKMQNKHTSIPKRNEKKTQNKSPSFIRALVNIISPKNRNRSI